MNYQNIHQQTLAKSVSFKGIGLHNGKDVTLTIKPAEKDSGIVFKRIDLNTNNIIKATYDNVVNTKLCTVIASSANCKVSTIEHIMSAFYGCEIDNALVEIDGPECPILDGSALPYVAVFNEIGFKKQGYRKYLEIIKPITVVQGEKKISALPYKGTSFGIKIDFASQAIGAQEFEIDISNYGQIAYARTFGFTQDLETLLSHGFAQGASLENVVAIDKDTILNPEGLRCSNEFVKHKLLDCIGDLYLSGSRIIGKIQAVLPSHELNNLFLRELFKDPNNYRIIDANSYFAVFYKSKAVA